MNFAAYGAVGFAPVRNYSRQMYGGASQNWAVSQDRAGRMYFANGEGLLKFDGIRWSLHHLPNYTAVRAVFADDKTGRIYVGGSREFGYFHTDPKTNRLSYVSMAPGIPKKSDEFTEIWNINEIEEGVIAFQGDYKIFISRDKEVSVIDSREKITASACMAEVLYAGSQNGNLFALKGNRLQKIGKTGDSRIVGILPFSSGAILAVTASEGLFVYENGAFAKPRGWEFDSFLKENQAFCATSDGAFFAFGTVNNGAVVKNALTGETIYINKQTGLQNNTVLGLGYDFSANLWLCLDNGIGYAMVDSPVFNLLGAASDAGAGYTSMLKGQRLLLGTNRGLFETRYPFASGEYPPNLMRIHSGQVWSLDSIGNDIFVSADDGLYVMKNGISPVKIAGLTGGSWYVASLKSAPDKALVSAYDGFYILSRSGSGWNLLGKVRGYDDIGGKFVEDNAGNIWLAHWIKGIYKLRLAPDFGSFASVKLYTSKDGLPNERDNSLAMYNGKLRIATASGEFYMVDDKGKITKDEILSKLIPLKYPAHFYTLPSGMSFAFSPRLVWKMTRDSQGKMIIDSLSLRTIANSLIPGFEHVGFLDRNNMLVSHQDGFYSVNLVDKSSDKWKNGVFVESMTAGDSVIFSGLTKGPDANLKIPYNLNSLSFQFAAPEYRFDNAVLFSCKLEGYDEWSTPSENPSKEYTQLKEGEYTLRLRALNTTTGETAESSFSFTVLPPWYRSVWAKVIYAILVVLIIFYGYRLFVYLTERNAMKIKLQKEAEMEMLKKEAEKEALKKDYEIASLKSEQLEQDIKHKSSELSNTAMNVIRKNEILTDISSMLSKLHEKAQNEGKTTPSLQKEVDKIQKLIRENISHDDDWKKFNQNFDIVYADFTKHLTELYPALTVSDKRLCCYLKMGLSSKDIAPILGISPKSVEMNRYRLRQKMSLGREVNLVEYLHGI